MGLVKRQPVPSPRAGDGTGRRATERDVRALLVALGSVDADVRRRAVLDLAGETKAVPALLSQVGPEADRAVREALLTVLAAHDRADVVGGLLPHLGSDDAPLRNAVVEALAAMRTSFPSFVPTLLRAPDADVRVLTVMVLAQLRDPQVPQWLHDVVRRDAHANVVAAALGELVESGDPGAAGAGAVATARFPDDPFLRFTAQAAGRLLDPT